MAIEIVSHTPEEIDRMNKCEQEILLVLKKYGCEMNYSEIKKNGVVIQSQFSAEVIKK